MNLRSRFHLFLCGWLLLFCCVLIDGCSQDEDTAADSGPAPDDDAADDDVVSDDDQADDDQVDDDSADDDTVDDDSGDDDATPPPNVKTLSWLKVEDGGLVDEYGRQWLMRGINARVAGLFDGSGEWAIAPAVYAEWDAWAMANFGFNLFRLPINWSALEPIEGEFSESYLALLDQVVAWARDAGVYVLIDFHQDKYSKYIGDDGAPKWAIYPPLPDGAGKDADKSDYSLQIMLAVANFFNNHEQIRDRFMPAWRLVVSRYVDAPHVVGFEVMNEPITVYLLQGRRKLYEFYEQCAAALREVDERHAIWLEPDVYRNKFLWAPLRDTPFPDDNVVYEPHMYPNFNGMAFQTVEEWVSALTGTFDHLIAETVSWGAAPVIGEWGTHPYDDFAPALFEAIQDLADKRKIGLAFWLWKEKSSGNWGLFDYDSGTESWTERTGPGMDALLRPGVMAVPGRLIGQVFDMDASVLTIEFEAGGGEGAPLVYIPARYYPEGATVELDGEPIEVTIDPDTQRALLPWNGQAGAHELVVRPK